MIDSGTCCYCHGPVSMQTGLCDKCDGERVEPAPLDAAACSVSEFQKAVSKWASETFPHQTPHSKMTHLRKEIDELAEDTSDGEEMADCFILLLNLAEMAGVDLMAEARRKMEINRKRKWGAPDADGVCHHVKQNVTTEARP